MKFEKILGRPRRVRILVAVALALLAVGVTRAGKRKTGLLAGIGALAIGGSAVKQYLDGDSVLDGETTGAEGSTLGRAGDTSHSSSTRKSTEEGAGVSTSQKSRSGESLTCASCGEPIRVGEGRGPNEQDQIVHDRCM